MNRQSNNDPSTHFKMYKGGKKWVFAGLTAVTLLTASGTVAHADDASVSSAEPAATTTANTQNNTNSAADSSAVAQSTANSASTENSAASNASQAVASQAAATSASAQSTEVKQAAPEMPRNPNTNYRTSRPGLPGEEAQRQAASAPQNAPQRTMPVSVGPKIGRNDPCPCGSGKKYKNCHGRNA